MFSQQQEAPQPAKRESVEEEPRKDPADAYEFTEANSGGSATPRSGSVTPGALQAGINTKQVGIESVDCLVN